jgi:hypothetical protein
MWARMVVPALAVKLPLSSMSLRLPSQVLSQLWV